MVVWVAMMPANNLLQAQVILERTFFLQNFPSGSAIEFYQNKLYLIGDDATQILILNPDYKRVDSINLFKGNYRISKNKKVDLESSAIVVIKDQPHFFLLGSSSTPKREKLLLFPASLSPNIKSINIKRFNNRVTNAGVKDLNYEGLATVNEKLVLSNRGHINKPLNQFIITELNFYDNQKDVEINVIDINLDKASKSFVGISGLTYVPAKDLLLFTASTESTINTYDDGEIEDSYLGWISNFSTKLNLNEIAPDGFINLAENNQSFKKQKVESVCVQEVQGNTLILHLIADNDNGRSTLFKMRLSL
jgi:hypothetical protein